MMKMLRATRVEPTFGAQMAFERVAQPLGWIGLGALTAGAAAWALSRSRRWPSNGEEPDGQEPVGRCRREARAGPAGDRGCGGQGALEGEAQARTRHPRECPRYYR